MLLISPTTSIASFGGILLYVVDVSAVHCPAHLHPNVDDNVYHLPAPDKMNLVSKLIDGKPPVLELCSEPKFDTMRVFDNPINILTHRSICAPCFIQ